MEVGSIAYPSSSAVQCLLKRVINPRCSFRLGRFSFQKLYAGGGTWSLFAASGKNRDKLDTHGFVPKPDEATDLYTETVFPRKKVVKQDEKIEPEFADAEEKKYYYSLKLQLESDLKLERMHHYEVVYLVHKDHVDEVDIVISKVQDYIKEKKGRIWRLNKWGLRRLCYKIKGASNANYILMNFEIEAKWINDFKSMLDKDDRIIRHLVIKRDEAITEDCLPPPEFHTIQAAKGMEEDYYADSDDEEEEGEEEEEEVEEEDEGDEEEEDMENQYQNGIDCGELGVKAVDFVDGGHPLVAYAADHKFVIDDDSRCSIKPEDDQKRVVC